MIDIRAVAAALDQSWTVSACSGAVSASQLLWYSLLSAHSALSSLMACTVSKNLVSSMSWPMDAVQPSDVATMPWASLSLGCHGDTPPCTSAHFSRLM